MGRSAPSRRPRLTHQSLKILKAFLEGVGDELSGADIMRRTGLSSGTTYPILLRFAAAGLLESRWEKVDPSVLGRPRQRLYSVTAFGGQLGRDALRQVSLVEVDAVPSSAA